MGDFATVFGALPDNQWMNTICPGDNAWPERDVNLIHTGWTLNRDSRQWEANGEPPKDLTQWKEILDEYKAKKLAKKLRSRKKTIIKKKKRQLMERLSHSEAAEL